jgi:hypothetical protein
MSSTWTLVNVPEADDKISATRMVVRLIESVSMALTFEVPSLTSVMMRLLKSQDILLATFGHYHVSSIFYFYSAARDLRLRRFRAVNRHL